jgi:DNA-binding IclR family transcriptional regulator
MPTPTNKSIIKALDLVEIVCSAPDGLSLREAATAAKLSLATTHRLLSTLKIGGAVSISHGGTYTLGPRLLALHEQGAQSRRTLQAIVQAHLDRMLSGPGVCVRFSVLDMPEIYVFAGADTCANPKAHAVIGAWYEAYCTAPGKVLLAGLSPRKLDDYVFNAGFVALTAKTIVVPSRLAEEIKRVHLTGYAVDSGEFFDRVRAIAVPVRSSDGQVIAALSVAGVAMSLDNIAGMVAELHASASDLADKIGRIQGGLRALHAREGSNDGHTIKSPAEEPGLPPCLPASTAPATRRATARRTARPAPS